MSRPWLAVSMKALAAWLMTNIIIFPILAAIGSIITIVHVIMIGTKLDITFGVLIAVYFNFTIVFICICPSIAPTCALCVAALTMNAEADSYIYRLYLPTLMIVIASIISVYLYTYLFEPYDLFYISARKIGLTAERFFAALMIQGSIFLISVRILRRLGS